nr:hypothetical protein [Arthrobacter sp. ZGTC412]
MPPAQAWAGPLSTGPIIRAIIEENRHCATASGTLTGLTDEIATLRATDARGEVGWSVSVASTVNRAHEHGTNLPRTTGCPVELHESVC